MEIREDRDEKLLWDRVANEAREMTGGAIRAEGVAAIRRLLEGIRWDDERCIARLVTRFVDCWTETVEEIEAFKKPHVQTYLRSQAEEIRKLVLEEEGIRANIGEIMRILISIQTHLAQSQGMRVQTRDALDGVFERTTYGGEGRDLGHEGEGAVTFNRRGNKAPYSE